MPIAEAGEVSTTKCIADCTHRSSHFSTDGTIFRFNGRIGAVGYPPGGGLYDRIYGLLNRLLHTLHNRQFISIA